MPKSRRKLTAEFKTRVALDALSGEVNSRYGVYPNQISQCKQKAKEQIAWLAGILLQQIMNLQVASYQHLYLLNQFNDIF